MGTFLEEVHTQAECKIQCATERACSSLEYKIHNLLMAQQCFTQDQIQTAVAEVMKLRPSLEAKVRRDCMTSLFENLGLLP